MKTMILAENDLERKLTILFSSTFVVGISIFWIGFEIDDFDPMIWIPLLIGSSFGFAVTIIASEKSQSILKILHKSENEKKDFSKFVLQSNFEKLNGLLKTYLKTMNENKSSDTDKRIAFKVISPSLNTFLNICESTLPNIGDKINRNELKKINEQFSIIHRIFLILESGSMEQFIENVSNLENSVKSLNKQLCEL